MSSRRTDATGRTGSGALKGPATVNAVLFDLFETLVTEAHVQPTRAGSLGAALGLDADAFRAEWKIRRPRVVLGQVSFAEALSEICRRLTGRVDAAAVQRVCDQRVGEKATVLGRINDEVAALVTDLSDRGVALGVVSNCFEEDVRAWQACTLAPRFGCAIFSFAEGVAKPEPGIYWRALQRLGVGAAETLFVGDGADDELTGAAEVGLRAFRATWFTGGRAQPQSEIAARDLAACRDVLQLVAVG
jgi:putative hydrolase of the HAD superfamily